MNILAWFFPLPKYQSGVYRIANRRTGAFYIGATTRPMVARLDEHRSNLRAGRHHNDRLQADWQRYGDRSFRFEVIEVVLDPESVFDRERHWQRLEYHTEMCYNPDPSASLLPPRPKPAPDADRLETYKNMRAQGYTRDQARAYFHGLGEPFNNDLWARAAPIVVRENGAKRFMRRD